MFFTSGKCIFPQKFVVFFIPDAQKMHQEQNSLVRIGDSFKKIIVVKDRIKLWRNEEGIVIMGIMDFLLNPDSLEL